MRSGWGSKGQQRQIESVKSSISRLERVGRMQPVPLANLSALSDIKTRGAQVSFLVTSLEGIDHFVLLRNFSRDPGSAKALNTWPAASLKTTPQTFPVALHYADGDPAIAGKIAYYWVKAVPASTRTTGNEFLSGPQKFDASNFPNAKQIAGDFASYQAYTPTTLPLSAATGVPVNAASISVAPFQIQYPFDSNGDGVPDLVSYNGGTITPLLDATTYYVYFDDPTYHGGAEAYIATVNNPDVNAGLHRQYVGTIVTPAHGGGGTIGKGGGGGACFSGNTLVQTDRGRILIREVKRGDQVISLRRPVKVSRLLVHEYDGMMHEMGCGELVTPGHRIYVKETNDWRRAEELFPIARKFKGWVYNLELKTRSKTDESHCYTLGNGQVVHNVSKL